MSIAKFVKDGFVNILSGLGGEKDPRGKTYFVPGMRTTQQFANDFYTYNGLAGLVVDVPIDDATRKWRELIIEDTELKQKYEETLDAYDLKTKVNQATKWAMVFGGAAIIIVLKDEDPAEPLDISKVRKDSLKNLIVLDRYNIFPETIANTDILSDNFGEPDYYTVTRGGAKIHHSRIVKFPGVATTLYELEIEQFWGSSLYNRLREPIENSQTTSDAIATLIQESNVDVYKIKDLNDLVAQGQDDLVVKRLQLAHKMKSIINGIALDAEDDYDKKSNTFASLADIDDRGIQKVAGLSGIPVTKLLGISPGGMNATGISDMRNYYDKVSGLQENYLRPRLDILDAVIMASEYGSYEPVKFKFLPLQQLSEGEQADVDLKNSQRDQAYSDLGVIDTTDILTQLANNGTYVSIDQNRVLEEEESLNLEDFEE